ncbi:MAG: bifunctional adenosylcobinamide kinase/adenosylcobinamide-phosphate guanylyltransferase [Planctomycetota bacterium]
MGLHIQDHESGESFVIHLGGEHDSLGSLLIGGGRAVLQKIVWVHAGVGALSERQEPVQWLEEQLARCGTSREWTGAFITSRRLDARVTASAMSDVGMVEVVATVGLGNALRVGDPMSASGWSPGTINLALLLPVKCEESALAEALMLAQEAKALAMLEAGISSTVSALPASGTGTDAAIAVAPTAIRAGESSISFVGKHTSLGMAIGCACLRALRAGIADWQRETGSAQVVLVGGGARSGKSSFAEARALSYGGRPIYVATAQAFDDEMRERILLHQRSRGDRFQLRECPMELASTLEEIDAIGAPAVLVDCLTLWMSNLLCADLGDDEVEARSAELVATLQSLRTPVVVVSNEVGLGIVPNAPMARRFRDLVGRLHQRIAEISSETHFAALGTVIQLRPGPLRVAGAPAFRSVSGSDVV